MLATIALRATDNISKLFFFHPEMPINHSLYRPQERVITGYRSPAKSNCGACRGGEWPLGVSIRSGAEKSCVSKRQCPLTDIYPPLSLLFLFSRFLSSLPPFLPLFSPFSQAWSEVSTLQQESLQKTGSKLRLLDESERVPLCPSASGALSKFSNCCRLQRGGRGRGRVCFCERCRESEKKRIAEMGGGIMKTSRVWAPLLLLPLTSLVSSTFL